MPEMKEFKIGVSIMPLTEAAAQTVRREILGREPFLFSFPAGSTISVAGDGPTEELTLHNAVKFYRALVGLASE